MLSSEPVPNAKRVLALRSHSRIAAEASAAAANAIVSGRTRPVRCRDAEPSNYAGGQRMSECHFRRGEHRQEWQHRAEAHDFCDGAEQHEGHQQGELAAPPPAQVVPKPDE